MRQDWTRRDSATQGKDLYESLTVGLDGTGRCVTGLGRIRRDNARFGAITQGKELYESLQSSIGQSGPDMAWRGMA